MTIDPDSTTDSDAPTVSRDAARSRRPYAGERSKTEHRRHISKRALDEGRIHLRVIAAYGIDLDADRPKTRGDCIGGARPCPWVGCKHNLYLDESEAGLKFNFPDLEPEDMPPGRSCSLDVADEGGGTLEDIALVMNLTRERVRQIETPALANLKRHARLLGEYADEGTLDRVAVRVGGGSVFKAKPVGEERDAGDTAEEDEPPTRISFFAEAPRDGVGQLRDLLPSSTANDDEVPYWRDVPGFAAEDLADDELPATTRVDELVCVSVWNIFAKESRALGFDCRSKGSIAAAKALAARRAARGETVKPPSYIHETKPEEATMAKTDDLTDRQREVLDVYERLLVHLGRLPANTEIAAELTSAWASENTVRKVRGELVEMGLAKNRPRGGTLANGTVDVPKPIATSTPRTKASKPAPAVVATAMVVRRAPAAKPPRPTGPSSVVDELTARRDALLADAEKLTAAIEVLRPAS